MKRIATYIAKVFTSLFRRNEATHYDSEAGLFI